MHDWVIDAATYVGVQSMFFEVTVVFPYKAAHSAFGASLTYLLSVWSGLATAVQRSPSADRDDTEQFCTGGHFQGEHAAATWSSLRREDKQHLWQRELGARTELPLHACIWWSSEFVQYFGEARQVVRCAWRHFVACQETGTATWTRSKWSGPIPHRTVYPWIIPRRWSCQARKSMHWSQRLSSASSSRIWKGQSTVCSPQSLMVSGVLTGLLFFEGHHLRGSFRTHPPRWAPIKSLDGASVHFANYLDGHITSLLIQVHWENADSCRSGHSSGLFELHEPFTCVLFLPGEMSTQSGIYNSIVSSRSATARSH